MQGIHTPTPKENNLAMRLRLPQLSLIALLCILSGTPLIAQTKAAAPNPGIGKQGSPAPASAPLDTAAVEDFEKKVRPVLVQYCYECHSHSANKSLGNLFLDSRAAILQGGQHGTGLVPGHPDKSLIVEAVRYTRPDLQMPPKKRLPDAVVADLADWVKHG